MMMTFGDLLFFVSATATGASERLMPKADAPRVTMASAASQPRRPWRWMWVLMASGTRTAGASVKSVKNPAGLANSGIRSSAL